MCLLWLLLSFQDPQDVRVIDLLGAPTLVLAVDNRAPLIKASLFVDHGRYQGINASAWLWMYRDPERQLERRAQQEGYQLTAQVEDHWSVLSITFPSDAAEQARALLGQILANRKWDLPFLKDDFRERKIRHRYQITRPEFVGKRALAQLLLHPDDPGHLPYRKPTRPKLNNQKLAADRDRILAQAQVVLSMAGDLTEDLARTFAEDLPKGGGSRNLPEISPRTGGPERQTLSLPINQVWFFIGRRSLRLTEKSYGAFLMADYALGGHFHARLAEQLRHRDGLTYQAGTQGRPSLSPVPYYLFTYTGIATREETRTKLEAVLNTFFEQGITQEELDEARSYLKGAAPFRRQSGAQRADTRSLELLLQLPQGFYDRILADVATLSREEVNAFIQNFYHPKHFKRVEVGD